MNFWESGCLSRCKDNTLLCSGSWVTKTTVEDWTNSLIVHFVETWSVIKIWITCSQPGCCGTRDLSEVPPWPCGTASHTSCRDGSGRGYSCSMHSSHSPSVSNSMCSSQKCRHFKQVGLSCIPLFLGGGCRVQSGRAVARVCTPAAAHCIVCSGKPGWAGAALCISSWHRARNSLVKPLLQWV